MRTFATIFVLLLTLFLGYSALASFSRSYVEGSKGIRAFACQQSGLEITCLEKR